MFVGDRFFDTSSCSGGSICGSCEGFLLLSIEMGVYNTGGETGYKDDEENTSGDEDGNGYCVK